MCYCRTPRGAHNSESLYSESLSLESLPLSEEHPSSGFSLPSAWRPQTSCCQNLQSLLCVFPVEPQSPNGKNINLHKSGVSTDSTKSGKRSESISEIRTFCTKSCTFWHSFWNRRKPHFLSRLMFLPFGLRDSTGNTQSLLSEFRVR